jgi:hypothetical protein
MIQGRGAVFAVRARGRGDNRFHGAFINPRCSADHLANGGDQPGWRIVLKKNSSDATLKRQQHVSLSHGGRHDENPAAESTPGRLFEKCRAVLLPEIVVEKGYVGAAQRLGVQCFQSRCIAADDSKIGFRIEQSPQALAEKTVIVDQQNANGVLHFSERTAPQHAKRRM